MLKSIEKPEITRQRLLAAAGEVFADKGFRAATVRDICHRANANIASLHYHFGDKKSVYLAVFQSFVDATWRDYPLPKIMQEPAPAEQRLAAFILATMRRLLAEGRPAWVWKLAVREMCDPTAAMDIIAERLAKPLFTALVGLVRELLGPEPPDRTIRLFSASIVGQCFFYRFAGPMITRIMPDQEFDEAALAELAEHITKFSLAAIEKYKMRGAT